MLHWKRTGGVLAAVFCILLPVSVHATVPEQKQAGAAVKPAVQTDKAQPTATKPAEPGPYQAGDTRIPPDVPPVGKGNIIARAGRVIRNKNYLLPAGYQNVTIQGKAEATKNQAAQLIMQQTPVLNIGCGVGEIVKYYWEEAEKEGIRPDLALAQALVETGFFKFGGDVKPWQHNFCGLGTTGGGVRGAAFKTPQEGVRAHIQHLVAYSRTDKPKTAIIDPRFQSARSIRLQNGLVTKWSSLNWTWAMGGEYAEKIFTIQQRMLLCEDKEPRDAWHDYSKMEAEYERIYEERKKHGWASPSKQPVTSDRKTEKHRKDKKKNPKGKERRTVRPGRSPYVVSTAPVAYGFRR